MKRLKLGYGMLVITLFLSIGCSQNVPIEELTVVKVTHNQIPLGTLFYLAEQQGFFEKEGLDIELSSFPTGKSALDAVIQGGADVALVADTPIVLAILDQAEITTFGTIGTSYVSMAVVAGKDQGILVPADLKGKKIGVTQGTNADFFLSSFLLVNRIPISSVEIINYAPGDLGQALASGEVQAISAWTPITLNIQEDLGARAITFLDDDLYLWHWNLVSTTEFVQDNPLIIKKMMTALRQAEQFLRDQPLESLEVVRGVIGEDMDALESEWHQYQLAPTLHHIFLLSLEDQARWAIENNFTTTTQVPNFLDHVYVKALQEVNPEAVTIIK